VSRRAMSDALEAQTALGAVGSSALLGAPLGPPPPHRGLLLLRATLARGSAGGHLVTRLVLVSSVLEVSLVLGMSFVLECPVSWNALCLGGAFCLGGSPCLGGSRAPSAPNATLQAPLIAEARHQRRLLAVACKRLLGCVGVHEAVLPQAHPLSPGPWLVSPHRLSRRWLGGTSTMHPETTAASPMPLRWLMMGCNGLQWVAMGCHHASCRQPTRLQLAPAPCAR
jgi:hypothetical protein